MATRSDHPLLVGEKTHFFESWEEWLECWDTRREIELRHSLLHFGLRTLGRGLRWVYSGGESGLIPTENSEERVLFYLRIADGWLKNGNFAYRRKGEEQPLYPLNSPTLPYTTGLGTLEGAGELERRLAEKAFAVLFGELTTVPDRNNRKRVSVLNYWPADYKRDVWLYAHHLSTREVVAFLRFFRVEKGRIRNLPGATYRGEPLLPGDVSGDVRAHLIGRVQKFLADLVVFLWTKFSPQKQCVSYDLQRKMAKGEKTLSEDETEEVKGVEEFNRAGQEFAKSLARHHYLLALILVYLGELRRLYDLPMDERTVRLLTRFALRKEVKPRGPGESVVYGYGNERKPESLEEVMTYSTGVRSAVARFLLLHKSKERVYASYAEEETRVKRLEEIEAERKKLLKGRKQ
jgi:hypothetical protein